MHSFIPLLSWSFLGNLYYSTSKLTQMRVVRSLLMAIIILGTLAFALGLGINKLDLYPTDMQRG